MSTEKMFQFSITNMTTKENCLFLGQGTNLKDALSDALKNANDTFRPKNDGRMRPPNGVRVLTAKATHVNRTVAEFEGDAPYREDRAEEPAATTEDLGY